jgi:hypothetical protein
MQADRGGEKPMAMYLISRLDEGWSVLHYITLRTTLLVQMLILIYSRLLYPSYTTAACYRRYLYWRRPSKKPHATPFNIRQTNPKM